MYGILSRMGRHTQGGKGGVSRGVVAAVLGLALIVIGGLAARALIADDGSADGSAAAETSSATKSTATETSSSSSTTTKAEAGARVGLAACAKETAAGDKLVAAMQNSARDWRLHTEAQTKMDSGEYTRDQTLEVWADSKARGADDLKGVSAAKTSYDDAKGACADLEAVDVPDTYADAAGACTQRAAAMRTAIEDGLQVNQEWADHIEMMDNKDQMDGDAYHAQWMGMVDAAPGSLDDFASSSDDLSGAPDCSAPS